MKAKLVFVDDRGEEIITLDEHMIDPDLLGSLKDARRVIDFLNRIVPVDRDEKRVIISAMIFDERARQFILERVEKMEARYASPQAV
jgi:hypothetical protein